MTKYNLSNSLITNLYYAAIKNNDIIGCLILGAALEYSRNQSLTESDVKEVIQKYSGATVCKA